MWSSPPDGLVFDSDRDVHVWRVALDPPPGPLRQCRAVLNESEAERASAYHFDADRRHFIAARGALRFILARYLNADAAALTFDTGAHGKPALGGPDAGALRFNLSHAGTLALVAVTRQSTVGIDLEPVRQLDDADALAERFFSPREVAAYRALPPDERPAGFFRCWTRKEAFVKAVGTGISLGLDQFDVTLAPDAPPAITDVRAAPWSERSWHLTAFRPADGYEAALVTPEAPSRVHRLEWTLDPSNHAS